MWHITFLLRLDRHMQLPSTSRCSLYSLENRRTRRANVLTSIFSLNLSSFPWLSGLLQRRSGGHILDAKSGTTNESESLKCGRSCPARTRKHRDYTDRSYVSVRVLLMRIHICNDSTDTKIGHEKSFRVASVCLCEKSYLYGCT